MNRKEQNAALKDLERLDGIAAELKLLGAEVLARGRFGTGIYVAPKTPHDPERQTPPPAYNDETGEHATSRELSDEVTKLIVTMADNIHKALNIAEHIVSIVVVPADVGERAKTTIPDCGACGDPIVGKIHYGRWDDKCRMRFKRWVEDGNAPDEKIRFELLVRTERGNVHHP